jgi:hypothetical protein
LLYLFVVGAYFVLRFNGQWAESDSATFTRYIRLFSAAGELTAPGVEVYPNGYLNQAISTFILSLSGLSVESLQQLVYPLLAGLVVPVAWITYRELAGNNRAATIATLLLVTQPDFLFVILRSSHEKFTRTLMLLCLLLILRTLPRRRSAFRVAIYTVLLYGAAFALVASNYLLANSFFVALATAWAMAWVLSLLRPRIAAWTRRLVGRLPYVLSGCFLIVFLFTFYIYPPASHDLLVLRNVFDLITALVTAAPGQNEDLLVAYRRINLGWVNIPTFVLLSAANWLVLLGGTVLWFRRAILWIVRGHRPRTDGELLTWLLFAAFVGQGIMAVLADASGALGSNLQVRLFPTMSMVGVALIAIELGAWRPRHHIRRRVLPVLAAGAFALSVLSIMKATNEPLFSNKWSFYRSAELEAIQWADGHLTGADIWTEFDERLMSAYFTALGNPRNGFVNGAITPTTRAIVVSDITRLRSVRTLQLLPLPPDALKVYDNGLAQLYHLRPRTPYQP